MRGWVCRLELLLGLARAVIPRGTLTAFTASDSRLPQLEGQVPVFISPRNRVARLYAQALSSFFVASYYSQGYCGGIRTHLHTGLRHYIS
jgi:hypothetical protein